MELISISFFKKLIYFLDYRFSVSILYGVVVSAGKGEELLGFGCQLEQVFPLGEGDYVVVFSVDDEDGAPGLPDVFIVGQARTHEAGNERQGKDFGCHISCVGEGASQDERASRILGGEVARWSRPERFSIENDVLGLVIHLGGQIVKNPFCIFIEVFHGGCARAFPISPIIKKEDVVFQGAKLPCPMPAVGDVSCVAMKIKKSALAFGCWDVPAMKLVPIIGWDENVSNGYLVSGRGFPVATRMAFGKEDEFLFKDQHKGKDDQE